MKKINIGIVLLVLTLLAMVFFLIYQENTEKNDIKKIQAFLNDYYSVYNKYSLLYEEDRNIDKIIDKTKYDKCIEDMKNEIDKYIAQDDNVKQSIYNQYISRIEEQIKGKYIYNKHIKNFIGFSPQIYFDGIYAILRAEVEFEVDRIDRISDIYNKDTEKYEGETKEHVGVEHTFEYFALKKENGEYKILIHSMMDPKIFLFEIEEGDVKSW